jgi:NSS family neurotransmitter:Na+ symporter
MLFILANYAWTNFGAPEMIGGVIVLVTFPLIGYAIMAAAESAESPSSSQLPPEP